MRGLARYFLVLVPLGGLLAACEPPVATPPAAPPTVVAEFNPLASPPVVPTPNNLAFQGGDGVHLNVPDLPTDSPAQRALNAYLRTLTGFPASSTASAPFSAPLDPASVSLGTPATPGPVLVIDTTAGAPLGPDMLAATLSSDGKTLLLAPAQPFLPGHRYAVLVFGGTDPAGLRGASGEEVIASPAFFFLRSQNPLTGRCADPTNPACICPPAAVADPNDTTCKSIVQGLDDATARQVEPQRLALQAALGQLLPLVAPGREQNNLVLFWTFTITTQAMTVFDPASGSVPFPNDILIDPATGLVKLPIASGDPQAPLKMELNTLDGFSTSAPITVGVDGAAPIDAATLVPGRTVQLINLDFSVSAEQPTFVAAADNGQLVLAPILPLLSDQHHYAAVVTRGVSDSTGQPLLPSPAELLLLGPDPLFDGTHSTVTVLDDMQAAQLEMLRQALQPLVLQLTALDSLDRSQIAALWTFTTQSIARPLAALDTFPAGAGLSTNVAISKFADTGTLASAVVPFPTTNLGWLVLGTFESKLVIDPTTGLISFARGDRPIHRPAAGRSADGADPLLAGPAQDTADGGHERAGGHPAARDHAVAR